MAAEAVPRCTKHAILVGVEYDLTGSVVDGEPQAWCGGNDIPGEENVDLMHHACSTLGYRCEKIVGFVTPKNVCDAVKAAVDELWANAIASKSTNSLMLYICAHGKAGQALPSFFMTQREDGELRLLKVLQAVMDKYTAEYFDLDSGPPPLHTILVLDACYAGGAAVLKHTFNCFPRDFGVTVMSASPEDNAAWFDAARHGYFTAAVSAWLVGSAVIFQQCATAFRTTEFGGDALEEVEADTETSNSDEEIKVRAREITGDAVQLELLYNNSDLGTISTRLVALREYVMGDPDKRAPIAYKLTCVLSNLERKLQRARYAPEERKLIDSTAFCDASQRVIQANLTRQYAESLVADVRGAEHPGLRKALRAILNTLSIAFPGGQLGPRCVIRWSTVLKYADTIIRHGFTPLR